MLALMVQRSSFDAHAAVVLAKNMAWIELGSQRRILWCGYPSSPEAGNRCASQSEYVTLISLGTARIYLQRSATIVPQYSFIASWRRQIDVYFEPARYRPLVL